MQKLVLMGLMESAGRVSFVPDEYFRLTPSGRDFLRKNAAAAKEAKREQG
jgi:hypothetical protein